MMIPTEEEFEEFKDQASDATMADFKVIKDFADKVNVLRAPATTEVDKFVSVMMATLDARRMLSPGEKMQLDGALERLIDSVREFNKQRMNEAML